MRFIKGRKKDRNLSFYYRKLKRLKTSREQISLLQDIESPQMREIILREWNHESLTMSFLLRTEDEMERYSLLKLIEDQNSLSFIARRDPSKKVRRGAILSLYSLPMIMEILQQEEDVLLIIETIQTRSIHTNESFLLLKRHSHRSEVQEFLIDSASKDLLHRFLCQKEMEDLRESALNQLEMEGLPEEVKLSLLRVCEKPEHLRIVLDSLDTGTLAEIARGGNRRINQEIRHIAREQNNLLLNQLLYASSH